MENMKFLKDDLLKRMFTKSMLEKPSDDFTAIVMGRIEKEILLKNVNQPILSLKYWLLIGLGFMAAIFVLFGLDWSFMNGLIGEIDFVNFKLPNLSVGILGGFKTLFADITISPIIAISLLALASLIILDKLLKKKISMHIFLLI